MSQKRFNSLTVTLPAGGSVVVDNANGLDPFDGFTCTTIAVTGNITGTITLTKKVIGATRYTAFSPAATLDLTAFDERIITGMALAGLTLTHAGSGAPMTVRVVQSTE